MIQKRTHSDDAVSPVVGVMLMLVVTIVIAAIVAVFATGVASDTQTSKTAMFSVDAGGLDYQDPYLCNVTFYHHGGDSISLDDLVVNFNSYGSTSTVSGNNIKTASGSLAISSGDSLMVNTSGFYVGNNGAKVNYKIIYTPGNLVLSAGEIICE